jgi:osmoprotectant transport system ATP-binding protein
MLTLQNIYKSYNGTEVLHDVTLTVQDAVTHALIGSSGSGKTTILRITLGLVAMDRGYIKLDDQPLSSFSHEEWADRIGYVPQDGGLFPHLTAQDNVTLVARLRGWKKSKVNSRIEELCSLVDLDMPMIQRYPYELSGGQKQRVAIMRAAFMNPSVMLLDEPMGALDPVVRQSLQQELKSIFKRLKKTVVIVTHDLSEATFLAKQLTLLHDGRVVQTGTYSDLLLKPEDPFVTVFINAHRALPEVEA